MVELEDVMAMLEEKAAPENLEGMARYGITIAKRLGVSVPEMRKIAKQTGKDHGLAMALWSTGIAEAQIVASLVDIPTSVTEEQMEAWVRDFNSWDVCDQVCMNLFDKAPLAWKKVFEWSEREEEFVRRAAFALIACLAWHDQEAGNEEFIAFLPIIVRCSTDERNYVKKAVNWALRHIGKRNLDLNRAALETAREMRAMDSRAARWIASDAIRELESKAVQRRLNAK